MWSLERCKSVHIFRNLKNAVSNAYLLAKFRFDTAENEPAKNLQNFAKFQKIQLDNLVDFEKAVKRIFTCKISF